MDQLLQIGVVCRVASDGPGSRFQHPVCAPHSPWQRGTVENTNGLIRRDMPRRTDTTDYSDGDIQALMWNLNKTPRKCLAFKTPAEAFYEQLTGALEM